MNKQTTAIEWWENTVYNAAKRVEWKIKLNFKYYGWDKDYNRLTDEEIEHIYLSENPQTETKVEDVQVGGLPDKLDVHSTGLFPMKAELHPINDPDGLIILADVQTMELANEIVKRYNNFDAMYSALKDTVYEYENAMKLLAEATGMIYSENNVTISAKAIINNIQ